MRIAVFGGTFDPVHNGHIGMAKEVLQQGLVDKVWFMPARIPPHKLDKQVTPTKIRVEMLMACLPENCEICRHEIEKDSFLETSYSYATMRELKELYDHDFYFLFGMDSLNTLHFWREFIKFIDENKFIIYSRPGQKIPSAEELNENIKSPRLVDKLLSSIVELQDFPVSSTEVRKAVEQTKPIDGFVPEAVEKIIRQNQLYQEGV